MTRIRLQTALVASALGLCWSAHSLLAQTNLASARDGAKIADVSSSLGKQWRADSLLDGNPASTWATAKGKLKNQYVTVKLAVKRPVEIGAVALDNSVAQGHPPEAALRQFKLYVSATGGLDQDFAPVKLGSCEMQGGRQVFTFAPARAAYVKLALGGNYGYADWIELAEFEVFPAGTPPVERSGTPSVLLHSSAAEASQTAFASVAQSLLGLGATVVTFPGPDSSRSLSNSALVGIRVVIETGEVALGKSDLRALVQHCESGGGLVCLLPRDPEPLRPLLEALGVSLSPAAGEGDKLQLAPHWITEGLAPPELAGPAASLALANSSPLATRGGTAVVALAAEAKAGRLVVMPADLVTTDGNRDALELSRRAVLWAAAMEETQLPKPLEPVRLEGRAVFLGLPSPGPNLSFAELRRDLAERGLTVADSPVPPEQFARSDLGTADLLIAVMPAPGPIGALDLASWVASGGALLVLGDAQADVPSLIAVNEFLREFGVAMALSPSTNLSVGIRTHPVTEGLQALSRPGQSLGVWCLQGAPLAEMGNTPVAMARTFGRGRLIALDAGFAVDPVQPPPEQKRPAPAYGIQLEQNREFLARCVAWLLERNE